MNSLALLVCTLACGADVRESIPNATALYDVIALSQQFASSRTSKYVAADDGATLEIYRTEYRFSPNRKPVEPLSVGKLRVVPVPGHANLLLAGYVFRQETRVPPDHVWDGGCVLLDVDRNVVILPADKKGATNFLSESQLVEINAEIRSLMEAWAQMLVDHPDQSPVSRDLAKFQGQFVDPPPAKIECKLDALDVDTGRCEFQIQISGGGRNVESPYQAKLFDLLTTDLAIPAQQYFAAKPTAEQEIK